MRPYKEYEKLVERYEEMMNERSQEKDFDIDSLEPNDYVMFGNLMKEITETIKLPENRKSILSRFGNEIDGYTVRNKIQLQSLMVVAVCLSAALDKSVSQDELLSVVEKYHDPHAMLAFNQYTQVAEREMQQQQTANVRK